MNLRSLASTIHLWYRRGRYRKGATLSRLIAKDVRRKIQIVSNERIDEGLLTVRVQTVNLLYLANKLIQKPEFSEPMELPIDKMWEWSGKDWGGI